MVHTIVMMEGIVSLTVLCIEILYFCMYQAGLYSSWKDPGCNNVLPCAELYRLATLLFKISPS